MITTLEGSPTSSVSPDCPIRVRRAVMLQRWDQLTFVHWRYDPAVVQRLLPPWLEVEQFDGSAWVALVPFVMEVRAPGVGPVPWVSHFPETNVRTYATAPDGTTGVWFLSLEAARLGAVATARAAYDLPYFWAQMDAVRVGDVVSYRSRRRWPGPRGVRTEVAVEVGDPFPPHELGDLDHWLTARWRLYSPQAGRYALAEHPRWPLHRAELLHLDDQLVTAAGLPAPEGSPLVHFSPGVPVRISAPMRMR